MSAIEIQKGVKISLEELLDGVSKMDISSLEKFSAEINRLIARKKHPRPTERELELISLIYQPLEEETQLRYDELFRKKEAGKLKKKEHKEMLELVEVAETHNVKWLAALVELAQLRGISIEEVKKQLGIKNPGILS
jgi:hypothetical protein